MIKAALCVLALLVAAPVASADPWRPVPQFCVSASGNEGRCATARAASIVTKVLVAPGGTTAYVNSFQTGLGGANALLIFNRDPVTGRLTQRAGRAGCISQDTTEGECELNRLLGGLGTMELSPDGNQLYMVGRGGVVIFDVLPGGALQAKPGRNGCITADGSDFVDPDVCIDARGLDGPVDELALSPDGKTVYVGSRRLAVFRRDPATGVLTQLPGRSGCFAAGAVDGCADVDDFSLGAQLAVTPDGRSLYAPGLDTGLVAFRRDGATGALTQTGCITRDGSGGRCTTDARIDGALAALSSPDGRQIYLSTDNGIYTFDRAGDGALRFQSCINDGGTSGCRAGVQMQALTFSALSPDGQDLVVGSDAGGSLPQGINGGIVILARDPATGELTQRASPDVCVTNDGSGVVAGQNTANRCLADPLSSAPGLITFTSDSQFYAGGSLEAPLIEFKRDFYPACTSTSVPVAHDATTSIPLDCADRNGDPFTLQISAAPASGTLGAIDQATRRVAYAPFAGFAGADRFRFQAVAAGLASPEATVYLQVAPGAPAGQNGPLDADHDGFFSGQDCNDHDPDVHPGAREVRGNAGDENCDGVAEALPTITSGVSNKWRVHGARFTLTQLTISSPPKGAKLEIRCTGRHCPFTHRTLSGKVRRGVLNALPSLRGKVHFRAKQTIEVRIGAAGFNTKVAQLKLRAGHIPTTVPLCLPPHAARPQRRCG
jgi:hypothetical protein